MTHCPRDQVFGLAWGDPKGKGEEAEVECGLRVAQTGVQILICLLAYVTLAFPSLRLLLCKMEIISTHLLIFWDYLMISPLSTAAHTWASAGNIVVPKTAPALCYEAHHPMEVGG